MDEYNLSINDLPEGKCLATIKNRPWSLQIGFGILSLALCLTSFWYVGAFLLIICILSATMTQDYITSKVYADVLVVFNPKDPDKIKMIRFEDIISYEMDARTMSNVMLVVQNGPDRQTDQKNVVVASFQSSRLNRKLRRLMPDKDAAVLRMKQLQGNRLSNKEIKERKKQLKEEEKAEK